MPGLLEHSVADVIRQLVVDQGWGVDYVDNATSWATSEGVEADLPDDHITVYDTTPVDDGRVMVGGERQEHEAFQVRVRSRDPVEGAAKARQIAVGMDQDVYLEIVHVDSSVYRVWSVSRVSGPISLGYDTPVSKRFLFTLNCKTSIRMVSGGATSLDAILTEDGASLLTEDSVELVLEG